MIKIRSNAGVYTLFALMCLATPGAWADDPITEPKVDSATTGLPVGQEIEVTVIVPGIWNNKHIDPATITVLIEDANGATSFDFTVDDLSDQTVQNASPTDETIVSVTCKFKITLLLANHTYKVYASGFYDGTLKGWNGMPIKTGN